MYSARIIAGLIFRIYLILLNLPIIHRRAVDDDDEDEEDEDDDDDSDAENNGADKAPF
jgi:hypothetical protein